jgi:hypothetical protein
MCVVVPGLIQFVVGFQQVLPPVVCLVGLLRLHVGDVTRLVFMCRPAQHAAISSSGTHLGVLVNTAWASR